MPWITLVVMSLMLAVPASALAQPPPLFPKHRRGIYKNNNDIEVIDATPQSPPLRVDDPGVPDKGEFEINLFTGAAFSAGRRSMDVLRIDANYGVVLTGFGHELPTQVKIEIPVSAARESGHPYQMGTGQGAVGLKFNFYNDENRGVRLSIYPQVEFATPDSVERGLAEEGQAIVLPVLVSKETGIVSLVMNATLEKPVHAEGHDATSELGLGVGRAVFRKLAVMGDVHATSTWDFKRDHEMSIDGGFVYGTRKTIWYASLGHTLFSDADAETFFLVGIKVLIDPRP